VAESKLERILAAMQEALESIEGLDLCERNRSARIPDGTKSALVLTDGSVVGPTDRVAAWRRNPTFLVEIEPEIWGYVEGKDSEVGSLRTDLFSKAIGALWVHPGLRALLGQDGGVSISDCSFLPVGARSHRAIGVFVLGLRVSFTFDPSNP